MPKTSMLLVFFITNSAISLPVSERNIDDFKKTTSKTDWQNNPFVKNKSLLGPDYKLFAIIYKQDNAAALLNRQIVRVGDNVGKYRVLAIEPDAVILRDGQGVVRLGIDGEKR